MDAIAALGLKFKPLIIQIAGFLILFWILKKYLFGRVLGMIHDRSEEIRRSYEQNEKTAEEARQLKEQYAQQLAEVREKADAIIQEATKKAAAAGQEVIEKTRREAEQLREKRLAEIEQEKKKAIAEIRAEVVKLSMLLTARMIEKSIDRATADKLADEVMRDMGGLPS